MNRFPVVLNVNGEPYQLEIEAHHTLLEVLRDTLALTGTKTNCLEGECGACTVLVDGQAINSCLYLAVRANGREILTVEGLAQDERLHPLQQAFVEAGAVQCGYCTPGQIMTAKALLDRTPSPDEDTIVRELVGNLCRCTGYVSIRRAVLAAAEKMREQA